MASDGGRATGSGAPGGTIAGRYRITGRVGRGGMGTVWRATDELLHRQVAIKELHLADDGLSVADGSAWEARPDADRGRERALREARSLARIRHPHVVVVHDVVEEDARPWIVMELVDGRSLADMLRDDGPLAPREAARICACVAGALRAAHEHGIQHRDVKPANVLVEYVSRRVVLTDFGIARMPGSGTISETGAFVGSPEYTAPERMSGREAGPESDLWSLGALLCAAVDGRSPFHRESIGEIVAAVAFGDITPPKTVGPLLAVVRGLLDRDPARRMAAAEAQTVLTAYAETGEEPTPEAPTPRLPTPPEQARQPAGAGASGRDGTAAPAQTGRPAGAGSYEPYAPPGRPVPSWQARTATDAGQAGAAQPPWSRTAPGGEPLPGPGAGPPSGRGAGPPLASGLPSEAGSAADASPPSPQAGARASAASPRPESVPAPARESAAGSAERGRRGRWAVAVVAAVLIAVVAGGTAALVVTRNGGGHGGAQADTPPGVTTAQRPAPAPTEPSITPGSTPTSAAPAGSRVYADPAGFSVVLPDGYTRAPDRDASGVLRIYYWSPDHTFRFGEREQRPDPGGPYAVMAGQHSRGPKGYRGYRDGVITRTTQHQLDAALWEFTYDGFGDGSGARRTFDLCWTQGGVMYDVWLSSPVASTEAARTAFDTAIGSFTP